MNALTKIVAAGEAVVPEMDDVLVHVRFLPSSEIFTIDAKPEHLTPREWFERLYMGVPQHYYTRANGRGFFRMPRATFEAMTDAPPARDAA